jgi:hypothetical protein
LTWLWLVEVLSPNEKGKELKRREREIKEGKK